MTHVAGIVKDSVSQVVKQIRNKPDVLERNKRKLLFGLIFAFELNIVNDNKPLTNDETK
jgi:hypothetical protein